MRPERVDALSDGVVAVLASFTVAYHAASILGLARTLTLTIFAGVFLLIVVVRPREPNNLWRSQVFTAGRDVRTLAVVAAALAAGAAGSAVAGWNAGVWTLGLASVICALLTTFRRRTADIDAAPRQTTRSMLVVLVIAVLMATAVLAIRSFDQDDTFYVNRALHIASNDDPFPTKDTLFADQRYPIVVPPDLIAAHEAFVGVISGITHVDVRTVYYLVLPPLFAFLTPFALWRLARSARSPAPWLVVVMSAVFLVMHSAKRGLGTDALWRLHQGKSILAVFLVPWLWHHASSYARSRSRTSLSWMVLGGVAAVGLSSSGAFIGSLVIASATSAVVLAPRHGESMRSRLGAALRGFVALLYPAIATLVGALLISTPAAVANYNHAVSGTLDSWTYTAGSGGEMFLVITVVLIAWTAVRDRHLRIGLGTASLVIALLFSPPALDVFHRVGFGQTVWRMPWIVPVSFLVGLLCVWPLVAKQRALTVAVIIVVIGLLSTNGLVASGPQGKLGIGRPTWDRTPSDRHIAEGLLEVAPRNAVIAAPNRVSQELAVLSGNVHLVNPQALYTNYMGNVVGPSFHAEERLALTKAIGNRKPAHRDARDLRRGLDVLDVDVICIVAQQVDALSPVLEDEGFVRRGRRSNHVYWTRRR